MTGTKLLGRVREFHAHAQRGLLIEWGSWGDGSTAEEIFEAMARRQIEYYLIRPSQTLDELFHQSISTFLLEWANARRVSPHTVHIVSESWTGRAQELKDVLGGMPGVFAAGDVRHGSMNRVASAVGEGSIAIRLVHELFAAEQGQPRDLV